MPETEMHGEKVWKKMRGVGEKKITFPQKVFSSP